LNPTCKQAISAPPRLRQQALSLSSTMLSAPIPIPSHPQNSLTP
jgi:hypothetical protein